MGKTVAQKIFDAHRIDTPTEGVNVLSLDRVFCHEITTPIAINDLVARGKDRHPRQGFQNRRAGQNHARLGPQTGYQGFL